ncbi:hypothetical protein WA158_002217 [Blastocystis sp. Blastoise]
MDNQNTVEFRFQDEVMFPIPLSFLQKYPDCVFMKSYENKYQFDEGELPYIDFSSESVKNVYSVLNEPSLIDTFSVSELVEIYLCIPLYLGIPQSPIQDTILNYLKAKLLSYLNKSQNELYILVSKTEDIEFYYFAKYDGQTFLPIVNESQLTLDKHYSFTFLNFNEHNTISSFIEIKDIFKLFKVTFVGFNCFCYSQKNVDDTLSLNIPYLFKDCYNYFICYRYTYKLKLWLECNIWLIYKQNNSVSQDSQQYFYISELKIRDMNSFPIFQSILTNPACLLLEGIQFLLAHSIPIPVRIYLISLYRIHYFKNIKTFYFNDQFIEIDTMDIFTYSNAKRFQFLVDGNYTVDSLVLENNYNVNDLCFCLAILFYSTTFNTIRSISFRNTFGIQSKIDALRGSYFFLSLLTTDHFPSLIDIDIACDLVPQDDPAFTPAPPPPLFHINQFITANNVLYQLETIHCNRYSTFDCNRILDAMACDHEFTHLKHIDSTSEMIPNSLLPAIIKLICEGFYTTTQSLCMIWNTSIESTQWFNNNTLPSLKKMTICGMSDNGFKTFFKMAESSSISLEFLLIGCSYDITPESIISVFSRFKPNQFPSIKTLILTGLTQITLESVLIILQSIKQNVFPLLEDFEIIDDSYNVQMEDETIINFFLPLTEEEYIVIFNSLHEGDMKNIQFIMKFNIFTPAVWNAYIKAIQRNAFIHVKQYLLKGSTFPSELFPRLLAAIATGMKDLETLIFMFNENIQSNHYAEAFKTLKKGDFANVTTLSLDGNCLGLAGLLEFLYACRRGAFPRLLNLDISKHDNISIAAHGDIPIQTVILSIKSYWSSILAFLDQLTAGDFIHLKTFIYAGYYYSLCSLVNSCDCSFSQLPLFFQLFNDTHLTVSILETVFQEMEHHCLPYIHEIVFPLPPSNPFLSENIILLLNKRIREGVFPKLKYIEFRDFQPTVTQECILNNLQKAYHAIQIKYIKKLLAINSLSVNSSTSLEDNTRFPMGILAEPLSTFTDDISDNNYIDMRQYFVHSSSLPSITKTNCPVPYIQSLFDPSAPLPWYDSLVPFFSRLLQNINIKDHSIMNAIQTSSTIMTSNNNNNNNENNISDNNNNNNNNNNNTHSTIYNNNNNNNPLIMDTLVTRTKVNSDSMNSPIHSILETHDDIYNLQISVIDQEQNENYVDNTSTLICSKRKKKE